MVNYKALNTIEKKSADKFGRMSALTINTILITVLIIKV